MKFPIILLPSLLFVASCLAESPFEREMKQLKTQRDAAVAAATKAQDERYRAALEQIYQRSIQAKDAGAEAIKTELLTLGPLRELPAMGAATAAKPALPSTLFGGWTVGDATGWKAVYNFKADGTCECIPGSAKIPEKIGSWSKNGQKIEIVWPDGVVHAFDLPIKAGKLDGYTPSGARLVATKVR